MFDKKAKQLIADHDADAGFLHRYLVRFAGVSAKREAVNEHVLARFLSLWQKMLGLKQTGLPDAKTVKAMRFTPRCGNPDKPQLAKRGAWVKHDLTWRIEEYLSAGPSRDEQHEVCRAALASWAAVADLRFTEVDGQADLTLGVGQGRRDGFDGPSGVLAWAFLPNGSDQPLIAKLDSAETWIVRRNERGVLLPNVEKHEFGHWLGLEHDSVPNQLMNPYYVPDIADPQSNDIARIQRFYGKPKSDPVPTPAKKRTIIVSSESPIKISVDGKAV